MDELKLLKRKLHTADQHQFHDLSRKIKLLQNKGNEVVKPQEPSMLQSLIQDEIAKRQQQS